MLLVGIDVLDGGMVSREWGIWTKLKLEVLSEYLDRFGAASQRAGGMVYLDLFAGQVENTLRVTGLPIDGSAARALQAKYPFSRVVLFERGPRAAQLQRRLTDRFPDRADTLRVWEGDCNVRIGEALDELVADNLHWKPTFAFLDQQGPDIRWATLEKLARHRAGRSKTELWLFFGHSLLPRGLGIKKPNEGFARDVDHMLGTTAWRAAYEARVSGSITGRQLREELDNWMRWRIENVLGYQVTHTIPLHNESHREIYTMIFATDHDAGDRIMSHLYGLMLREFPHMIEEAQQLRAEQSGTGVQGALFMDDATLTPVGELYRRSHPWLPYGLAVADPEL